MEIQKPDYVSSEIYVITNTHPNGKGRVYIGQTQTHVLNKGKYRPFGSQKRLIAHFSEAFGNYKKQSIKLNNAIRKYGKESFKVDVIIYCECRFADVLEEIYIELYDSIRNGYNILTGGRKALQTIEQREKISVALKAHYSNEEVRKEHSEKHVEHYDQQKIDRFQGIEILDVTFGIYSNGLVHLLIRKKETPKKRERVTFRGEHVDRASAIKRAIIIAKRIANNDDSKLIVPERFQDDFIL